jgi:hypothetical protein
MLTKPQSITCTEHKSCNFQLRNVFNWYFSVGLQLNNNCELVINWMTLILWKSINYYCVTILDKSNTCVIISSSFPT